MPVGITFVNILVFLPGHIGIPVLELSIDSRSEGGANRFTPCSLVLSHVVLEAVFRLYIYIYIYIYYMYIYISFISGEKVKEILCVNGARLLCSTGCSTECLVRRHQKSI